MTVEFKLPDLGEGIEKADVVNVLVAEGHVIQPNQNVVELETDKAVVEVPCPIGGRVVKVHVAIGDKVPVGATILTLEKGEQAPVRKEAPPEEEKKAEAPQEEEQPAPPKAEAAPQPAREAPVEEAPRTPLEEPEAKRRPTPAGPATRRFARQLGVDLHQVGGSGPGGRITQEDVQAFIKKSMQAAMVAGAGAIETPPLPDFSQWGPVDRQPLSGIRRKTAENMSLAWHLAPRVTQYDLADITELEAARKRYVQNRPDAPGKITVTVLAIKAAMAALRAFPQFNSSLDARAGQIVFKKYFNMGIAVDTEHGLLVPVIKNADRKSVVELAAELEELASKARQRKLSLEQMQGGTFTITNLGGIGGTAFSPIVNYPEVAILGIARGRQEYVLHGGEPKFRLMLPLSLSYDHGSLTERTERDSCGASVRRFPIRCNCYSKVETEFHPPVD
jgi:pyruvate dehydrogenase E2 component (dihydrolipoamide acetyltransferase)